MDYRWVCPNGHPCWERTNSHLWCSSCRRALENDGLMKVQQAEHWEIFDKKDEETIPYSAVRFAEDE